MGTQELKLSAILSIDIPELSYSGEADDEASSIDFCHSLIQVSAGARGGDLVKAIGDSFVLTFANCQDAIRCAMDIAGKLSVEASPALKARMGIHLGYVHFFERNVFGDAVDAASALQAAARPGTICLSGEVLSLAGDRMGLEAVPLSTQRQKALPAGIKAYEIPASGSPPTPKAASEKSSAEKSMATPDRTEGSPSLEEIRRAVLEEIRVQGRRLTVDEALRKFGWYGVEATEVIASLSEAGILVGKSSPSATPKSGAEARESSDYRPSDSGGDLGRSIESAIHSIVSEIERAVEAGSRKTASMGNGSSDGSGFHVRFDKESFKESAQGLKEVGREIKRQVNESRHAARHGGQRGERHAEKRAGRDPSSRGRTNPSVGAFEKYRSDLTVKAGKLRKGVAGGIISFLLINSGLWYFNLNYSTDFPWAPLVSIFWGFGLVDSVFSSIRASKQAREAEALPDLDEGQVKELKAIHKERDSIGKHFISTLSIPSALALINMATDRGNPWFVIPSAILAATFVIHFITYLAGTPGRSRRFFEKLGIRRGRRGLEEARKKRETTTVDLGAYADIYRDASESAEDIESSLSVSDPKAAAEMKPQLEGYLNQVLLLARTANELDAIIGEIPMEALEKDKAALQTKLQTAREGMKTEYEGSIKEIEKQEDSFKGLAQQREVIDLRLRSSVSQLQQLKMDLARAKAADAEIDTGRSESALSSIRARSEELSRYIDDLKEGNLEVLADPFLELERQYGAGASQLPAGEGIAPGSSASDH